MGPHQVLMACSVLWFTLSTAAQDCCVLSVAQLPGARFAGNVLVLLVLLYSGAAWDHGSLQCHEGNANGRQWLACPFALSSGDFAPGSTGC